jgi:hypothetical protein
VPRITSRTSKARRSCVCVLPVAGEILVTDLSRRANERARLYSQFEVQRGLLITMLLRISSAPAMDGRSTSSCARGSISANSISGRISVRSDSTRSSAATCAPLFRHADTARHSGAARPRAGAHGFPADGLGRDGNWPLGGVRSPPGASYGSLSKGDAASTAGTDAGLQISAPSFEVVQYKNCPVAGARPRLYAIS